MLNCLARYEHPALKCAPDVSFRMLKKYFKKYLADSKSVSNIASSKQTITNHQNQAT